MEKRIVFHIDVNNAFLSWTAADLLKKGHKKDIRTIASVIGGEESKRQGIVLAKSPVAKKYNIVTAETIYSAKKKCKFLEIYPPDYYLYSNCSKKLFDYLSNYSPDIEQYSIDECFLDMTNTKYLYDNLIDLAYKIKSEIKIKFGFTVNIGIGNNKFLAKMASDFEKPDKVHTLFYEEVPEKMWPLKIEDLFMVGKSSSEKLKRLNINTIGELANTKTHVLEKTFKNQAQILINHANGIDDSKVTSKREKNKCISISRTFPEDINDKNILKRKLLEESEEIGIALRKQKQYAKTIAITIRDKDFYDYSKQIKFKNPTNVTEDIYYNSVYLLDITWKREYVRNIGIRISDFVDNREIQIDLFNQGENQTSDKIQNTIDEIKTKYGFNIIKPAILYDNNDKNN